MYTTLTNANPVWARLLTAHKVLIMTHANTAFREYTVRGVGDPGVVVAAIECALEEWNTTRDGGDGDDVEWNRDNASNFMEPAGHSVLVKVCLTLVALLFTFVTN